MEFKIISFNIIKIYLYKTALYLAAEKGNPKIINLILINNKNGINTLSILTNNSCNLNCII